MRWDDSSWRLAWLRVLSVKGSVACETIQASGQADLGCSTTCNSARNLRGCGRLQDLVKKHSEFIAYPISLWTEKTTEKEVDDDEDEAPKEDDEEGKIEEVGPRGLGSHTLLRVGLVSDLLVGGARRPGPSGASLALLTMWVRWPPGQRRTFQPCMCWLVRCRSRTRRRRTRRRRRRR